MDKIKLENFENRWTEITKILFPELYEKKLPKEEEQSQEILLEELIKDLKEFNNEILLG